MFQHDTIHFTNIFTENLLKIGWTVAHTYNPSYVGGRDQEDGVLGQPRLTVSETPSQLTKARCGSIHHPRKHKQESHS
jgi:hypothetical protein